MTVAVDRPNPQQALRFDEFLARYGEDDRYELIDSEVFDLEPTGPHEEVAAFIDRKLNVQIDTLGLPYFLPQRCLIKPLGDWTGLRPDLVVLDKAQLVHEPLWAREPIITLVITLGSSVKLIVEVVSGNWQNDYARKVEEYALLGIPEFWIADYAALGGIEFIGRPKQPTLTICILGKDGYYNKRRFQRDEAIASEAFPNLNLTAGQILSAGQ
jgi:Uma2 family endonuclease